MSHRYKWSIRLSPSRSTRSLWQRLAGNTEAHHHGNEGCPSQPELGSSSTRPADNPIGLVKHRDNVRPLGINQRPDSRGPNILRYQLGRTLIQRGSCRHDYGALNEIL